MMGRPFRVARIFGIPIKVDLSWLFVVFLLTSSMALVYAREFPYLGWGARVALGLLASLGLFGSVLAHELAHALVAIRFGIPIIESLAMRIASFSSLAVPRSWVMSRQTRPRS